MPTNSPDAVTAVRLLPSEEKFIRWQGREGYLWLLTAGLLLGVGIFKGINLVIVLGYALIALAGLNWLLARRSIKGLAARRLARPPIYAGIPTEWNIEITDAGTGTGNCLLIESTDESECRWFFVRTPNERIEIIRSRLQLNTRGRHLLLPLKAVTSYPFGLIQQQEELLGTEEIVVLPRPARVDGERLRTWLLRAWAGRDEEQRRLRKVVDREAEIHGLRDYRSGDSPRRIHWRATARRNRLTVKEYEDAAPPRLLIILDPLVMPNSTELDQTNLELAISLTAGIVREWRRQAGARLTLIIAGKNPIVIDGPAGPAITERQLEQLALTEECGDPELKDVFARVTRHSLAAPTLVISTRADSLMPHEIYRALGRNAAFMSVDRPESWYQFETAFETETPENSPVPPSEPTTTETT